MAILQSERTNLLRHLEYGMQGLFTVSPAGGSQAYGNMGMRYFKGMGSLLYKINQMAPAEEATLTGKAYGAVGFTGLAPQPGDSVTVTITGGGLSSPVAKTVTVPTPAPGASPYTLVNLASALAAAFAQDVNFQAVGFVAVADYGSGPYSQSKVQVPLVSFVAPPGAAAFTVTVGFTGTTAPQILSQGAKLSPYMQQKQQGVIYNIYGYLPICDFLEAGWLGSQQQMSLMQADNVVFRHDENEQRKALYDSWVCRLAQFLQIPVGPGDYNAASGGGYSGVAV